MILKILNALTDFQWTGFAGKFNFFASENCVLWFSKEISQLYFHCLQRILPRCLFPAGEFAEIGRARPPRCSHSLKQRKKANKGLRVFKTKSDQNTIQATAITIEWVLIFLPSLSNSLKTLTNSSDVSFVSPLNSSIQPLTPAMFLARKIKITFALNENRPLLSSTSLTHAH